MADPLVAELLFDQLPDVVFFVKDAAGRYAVVNRTLMRRCGCARKSELIGRAATEVFPAEFGAGYAAQDAYVIAQGRPLHDRLELHLYPDRAKGWCLTHKIPLRDAGGLVIGLAGISYDLRLPDTANPAYQRVAQVIERIRSAYAEPLSLADLASHALMSISQLERYIQRILGLTPKQLIIKTRLEAATALLEQDANIAAIAAACGYADHSAFSRQFKAIVGVAPSEYRRVVRRGQPAPADAAGSDV